MIRATQNPDDILIVQAFLRLAGVPVDEDEYLKRVMMHMLQAAREKGYTEGYEAARLSYSKIDCDNQHD